MRRFFVVVVADSSIPGEEKRCLLGQTIVGPKFDEPAKSSCASLVGLEVGDDVDDGSCVRKEQCHRRDALDPWRCWEMVLVWKCKTRRAMRVGLERWERER